MWGKWWWSGKLLKKNRAIQKQQSISYCTNQTDCFRRAGTSQGSSIYLHPMGTCTTFWQGLYLLQCKSYILIATLLEKILFLEKSFNRELVSNSNYICLCKIYIVHNKKLSSVCCKAEWVSSHAIMKFAKLRLKKIESYPSPILRKILIEQLSFKAFILEISQSSYSSVLPHILKEVISG